MRILDNRYKIENIIDRNTFLESYKVVDSWENDKVCFMTIYHYDAQKDLIEYFIKKFINLTNIEHENILQSEKFNIVKSIDTKNTNMLMYYTINEYTKNPTLDVINRNLKLDEKLDILIQIILVLDFLHFKGIAYKFLNPSQIFVNEENKIKLQSISIITEKNFNSRYSDFEKNFISSGFTIGNTKEDITIDYYSLGMLIEYLFLEEDLLKGQKELFYNISEDLTEKNYRRTTIDLIQILNQIIDVFELDNTYDLRKFRDKLFFHSEAVGREKEITQVMKIDTDIHNGINNYKGLLVRGDLGVGKSRFLGEVSYRLKMKGREVYTLKISKNEGDGLSDISKILRQSIKDTPENLIDKYKYEFSEILPELSLEVKEKNKLDFDLKTEKFRMYNRISNYFMDLSKDRIIYLIIDDIQNSNYDFLQLLNYLLSNGERSNMFLIISYEDDLNLRIDLTNKIEGWISNPNTIDKKLLNFDLEEIGEIVKNILGTGKSYIEFASMLFRETQGNPKKIESLVKHLYETEQFSINEKGVWQLTLDNYSGAYLPTDLNKTTLRQLNLVKDKYYEIFKLMSVFDDFLDEKILLAMLKIKQKDLESILDELIDLKLIDKKLVDWGYSYSIRNIELKNLIYSELPRNEKTLLHNNVIKSILDLEIENMDYIFEELVHHFIKSKQSDKALDIVLEKIKKMDSIYSPQGIYLYRKAYNIAKDFDPNAKLDILGSLAKIYFTRGKLNEAKVCLIEYKNISLRLGEYDHLIKAETILADIFYMRNETDLLIEQINKIEKLAEEHDKVVGEIVALSLMGRADLEKGKADDAEKSLLKSLELSKKHGIHDHLGDIYNRLGVLEIMSGDTINALNYYKKSIIFYNETGNIIDSVRPINNIANIYADHDCNAEKAIEEYEKGLAITRKYDTKHQEIYFLNNLGNVNLTDYNFDKALEYNIEANKKAIKLKEINGIFISCNNLGESYLFKSEYDKAYELYKQANEMVLSGDIINPETLSGYYDFMVEFYISLGQWDKASEFNLKLKDMHKEVNKKDYLKSIYRFLLIKYFKEGHFNKIEINNLIEEYKSTVFIKDKREILLVFSVISLFENDMKYALEMLEKDEEILISFGNKFLNKIRDTITYFIDPTKEGFKNFLSMEEYFGDINKFPIKLLIKIGAGVRLYKEKEYESSIKYFMESLDIIYKDMLNIPDINFRFSFIRSRQTDFIKAALGRAMKKKYGENIGFTRLRDVNKDKLNDYFDITPIVNIIGNEEFSKIIKLDSYGEVLNINNTEELITKLTKDYKYNLDLIIKYISKETLANKAYVLGLDEKRQQYNIIVSLNGNKDDEINENILKLSDRTETGLLINNDMLNTKNQEYKDLLSNNVRGIICIPISMNTENKALVIDRRRNQEREKSNSGYIYLETDKVFNRFNKEKLKDICKLVYLVHVNLENNKLRIEATTDKLTGLYTRKYYEKVFDELINNRKTNDGKFSLLMLDIDKFKNVNDTYGHRKGDEVLREIGKTFKSSVRSTDIVARYGGEEFTILLENVGQEKAKIIAEKIRKSVQSMEVKGIDIPITISIGISIFPIHSQFKEELMEKADQALYYAKETGRNKVSFWDHSMTDLSNRADKLAGILTGSTEGDNRNILAIIDIIDLIQGKEDLKYKTFEFLGRLLDVVEAEQATLVVLEENKSKYYTRTRFTEEWADTPVLNNKLINRVKENKKGEFLIDWDNIDDIDPLSGIPNWESVIVLPLIKEKILKGYIYLSSPLKTKEFDFNSYNLSKSFANIFAGIV